MVLPPISISGFPGKRVDAYRAGIMANTFDFIVQRYKLKPDAGIILICFSHPRGNHDSKIGQIFIFIIEFLEGILLGR